MPQAWVCCGWLIRVWFGCRISEDRAVNGILAELLSADGNETYVRPAS